MLWVNVMNQLRKGLLGLPLYNPETNKWGQAHTNGAFAFTMFLYKNQTSEIVKFELTDDNFLIHLNQDNLQSEGRSLIKKFLLCL